MKKTIFLIMLMLLLLFTACIEYSQTVGNDTEILSEIVSPLPDTETIDYELEQFESEDLHTTVDDDTGILSEIISPISEAEANTETIDYENNDPELRQFVPTDLPVIDSANRINIADLINANFKEVGHLLGNIIHTEPNSSWAPKNYFDTGITALIPDGENPIIYSIEIDYREECSEKFHYFGIDNTYTQEDLFAALGELHITHSAHAKWVREDEEDDTEGIYYSYPIIISDEKQHLLNLYSPNNVTFYYNIHSGNLITLSLFYVPFSPILDTEQEKFKSEILHTLNSTDRINIANLIGAKFNDVEHLLGNLIYKETDSPWTPRNFFDTGVIASMPNVENPPINALLVDYREEGSENFHYFGIDGTYTNEDIIAVFGEPHHTHEAINTGQETEENPHAFSYIYSVFISDEKHMFHSNTMSSVSFRFNRDGELIMMDFYLTT